MTTADQLVRLAEGALCAQVDTELFFPPLGGDSSKAKSICSRCDVRNECLQVALDAEEQHGQRYGIWGGTSPKQRAALRRPRAAA